MELIRLENIHKTYRSGSFLGMQKKLDVLKGVDLSININECIGLVGRRGCGKSTLGRIVLNTERYNKGNVFYKNKELRSLTKTEYRDYRKNVQVVFQNGLTSFNPKWKVSHILYEPLKNFTHLDKKSIRNKSVELLEAVGLKEIDLEKYPHQFSGGQLQRVNIARSLAPSPALVVLDEAVSNLDMILQGTIIDLLKDLQNKFGTSYLFICHDMRLVTSICDKIHFIHNGVILETVKRNETSARTYVSEFLKFIDAKNYNLKRSQVLPPEAVVLD